MQIETERLLLRPITMEDAGDIFEYSKNPHVGSNAGWKPHGNIKRPNRSHTIHSEEQ